MPARFGRLPLRGMAVFEAAARHGKFAAAVQELAMTQAGVSQHNAQLEGELGVSLFHRRHRGVQLIDAGETFLLSVEQGMRASSPRRAAFNPLATISTWQCCSAISAMANGPAIAPTCCLGSGSIRSARLPIWRACDC